MAKPHAACWRREKANWQRKHGRAWVSHATARPFRKSRSSSDVCDLNKRFDNKPVRTISIDRNVGDIFLFWHNIRLQKLRLFHISALELKSIKQQIRLVHIIHWQRQKQKAKSDEVLQNRRWYHSDLKYPCMSCPQQPARKLSTRTLFR